MGGVKFGVEEGTKFYEIAQGPLLHAKFHPISATVRVYRTRKTQIFTEI